MVAKLELVPHTETSFLTHSNALRVRLRTLICLRPLLRVRPAFRRTFILSQYFYNDGVSILDLCRLDLSRITYGGAINHLGCTQASTTLPLPS